MAETLADKNKAHWDTWANHYGDKPWHKDLSIQVTAELRDKLDFIGVQWAAHNDDAPRVRLLDYACGPGMVTRALGPYVTETRGIDVSTGMVNKYNEIARESNIPTDLASARPGNLFANPSDTSLDIPELYDFDLAAVGFGFHHFEDPPLAIRRLAERLKPGGVVLIIDLIDDGHKFKNSASHTMHRHGFTEKEMKEIFEAEGLEKVGFSVMAKPVNMEMDGKAFERTVFLARASKAVS